MRPVVRVGFTPDGDGLITCSADGYTRLWNVEGAHFIRNFGPLDSRGQIGETAAGQGTSCTDFSVTSDGKYLAVGYVIEYIAFFSIYEAQPFICSYRPEAMTSFTVLSFSKDGRRLYVGGKAFMGKTAGILVLDVTNFKEIKEVAKIDTPSNVTALALSPLNDYVLVGFDNGSVQSFSTESFKPEGALSTPLSFGSEAIVEIKLHRDKLFTICARDRKVTLIGAKTLKQMKRILTEFPVHTCALHPLAEELFIYAGGVEARSVTQTVHVDDTFKLFLMDLAQDAKLGSFQLHVGPVHGIIFSPNGHHIASCSEDGKGFLIKVGEDLCNYRFVG